MKRVDSQNPLRGRRVGIALAAAAGCLLAMAALGSLDQAGRARGVPFLIPSLAASAAVLFAEP
ncbi:MAG: hypothetical protein M1337_00555, partial [Actinobacteria bacterium]|nr:hypothetical protein [Actinomycetota bacterium]